jgi:hypothetical protein
MLKRAGRSVTTVSLKSAAAICSRFVRVQCSGTFHCGSGGFDFSSNNSHICGGSPAPRLFRWFYRAPPVTEIPGCQMRPITIFCLLLIEIVILSQLNVNAQCQRVFGGGTSPASIGVRAFTNTLLLRAQRPGYGKWTIGPRQFVRKSARATFPSIERSRVAIIAGWSS